MENNINDRLVRIVGSIFFGFIIPNATGLMDLFNGSAFFLIGGYSYFILVAAAIWHGNRWLLFKLDKKYNWFINPVQKVIALVGMNIIYTSFVVILLLGGWYYAMNEAINWEVIKLNILICVVCVIFITHAYETVFLIKQRASDKLRQEQLERAKIQSELEALKNQIDPHFMFNSLNNLSYLISKNPVNAKEYTENLAEVYRYILQNKNQELILLEDELLFLGKYLELLYLRYGNSLHVNNHLSYHLKSNFLIPPISIFFAFENVVKHNEISNRFPMQVEIDQNENELCISNKVQPKVKHQASSQLGLKNLDERFKIITGQGISTFRENGCFRIKMPLLKIETSS